MRPDPKPVLIGREKPLIEPKAAQQAILNALRAMVRQSKELAEADYSTSMTIRQVRLQLEKKPWEMAELLGVDQQTYEKWEVKLSPAEVAKTMGYTAKMIDETYRLLSFSEGGPDSRREMSLGDLLKYLTADQFELFTKWVEEGKSRQQIPDGSGQTLQ